MPIFGGGKDKVKALHDAAKQGDLQTLRRLINSGVDKDRADSYGRTALMEAALRGHEACVKALLDAGADKDRAGSDGCTALMVAAQRGREACVKALLDAGADKDCADSTGWTALMMAALYGREACVKALLDAGADKNRVQSYGRTALMVAALYGREACVKALLDAGADKDRANSYGWTALMEAAQRGHAACVKALLDAGADKDPATRDGRTALMLAVQWGHEACVKALLDAGADPCVVDREGKTARDHAHQLSNSDWTSRTRIVALLDNAIKNAALHDAAKQGDLQTLRRLINSGVDKNRADSIGWTALMMAAWNGRTACVKALLDAGADKDSMEFLGKTALIWAAQEGHAACVKVLLDAGADKNRVDSDAETALMWAAQKGHEACVKVLLDAGADKECMASSGGTALMWAAGAGHAACVKALLDAGADKDCATHDGRTALMLAVQWGHAACVKMLLDAGADPCVVDRKGKTARDHAHQLSDPPTRTRIVAHLDSATQKSPPPTWTSWLTPVSGLQIMSLFGGGNVKALHVAAEQGDLQKMRRVISSGVDVNAEQLGWTALMLAAQKGHAACVKALLDAGADAFVVDREGKTARDLALQLSDPPTRTRIVALLDNATPRPQPPPPAQPPEASHLDASDSLRPSAPPEEHVVSQQPPPTQQQRRHSTALTPPAPVESSSPPCPPLSSPASTTPLPSTSWSIPVSELSIGQRIGGGSYGEVHAGKWKGTSVAVKVFRQPAAMSSASTPSIRREIDLLLRVRHPNVVQLLGIVESPSCMVLELMPRGSLYDVLQTNRTTLDLGRPATDLPWARTLSIAHGVALGMCYLHGRNILHRDLKSPNILLAGDWTAKVTDLGMSKLRENIEGLGDSAVATVGGIGSFLWLAPESIFEGKTSSKSDVWSFGVVMWELATGQMPWSHLECRQLTALPFKISQALQAKQGLPMPSMDASRHEEVGFSRFVNLMQKCLDMDAQARPDFLTIAAELEQLVEMQQSQQEPVISTTSSAYTAAIASGSCLICMDAPGTAALLHKAGNKTTSHGGYCEGCAEKMYIEKRPCPLCREPITGVLHRQY